MKLNIREDRAAWREVDGEVIVLDLESSQYLHLNPTGSALWSAMADGATEDELVERLVAGFDVDHDRARADVETFIISCREHGLVG